MKNMPQSPKDYYAGVTDSILKLYNVMPKEYQTTLLFQLSEITNGVKGKKLKKVEENSELPQDVLDSISKTLDFDDLFHFSGVCKNWRGFHKTYLRMFMQYQEPLLLQISHFYSENSFSLISISDQKVYCLKMLECLFNSFSMKCMYFTSCGGYFVKYGYNIKLKKSYLLINPFTRIKKVISGPSSKAFPTTYQNQLLLAFSKCSEEFVLVELCTQSNYLYVYQSRNSCWVTLSSAMGNQEWVVHMVVLHNIIHVVTNKANIGVLSLNSLNIKFLELKSTPVATNKTYKLYSCDEKTFNLVNCDEQLLVVYMKRQQIKKVYKIDFSTMSYVKLETLGDIALFCNVGYRINCYALSNPNRWGYESNSVYATKALSRICEVISADDKNLQKCITLPTPGKARFYIYDWCFKHLQHEIDYSLVE